MTRNKVVTGLVLGFLHADQRVETPHWETDFTVTPPRRNHHLRQCVCESPHGGCVPPSPTPSTRLFFLGSTHIPMAARLLAQLAGVEESGVFAWCPRVVPAH